MVLQASDLVQEIKMAVSSERASKWTTHATIINQAIAYFNAMHPWDSMVVSESTLDTVAGQSYIALPGDVRDITALYHNEGTTNWAKWVSPDRLTQLRAYDDDDEDYVGGYYVCVERGVPAVGGGLEDRLGLYPTPATTSTTGLFVMRYRRKLLPVGIDASADTQAVNVIFELEPLIRRLVRIFAGAIEEEDEAPLESRLEMLESSTMLSRMKENDGAMQPEIGQLHGGAAQQKYEDSFWWDSAIDQPS